MDDGAWPGAKREYEQPCFGLMPVAEFVRRRREYASAKTGQALIEKFSGGSWSVAPAPDRGRATTS